MRAKAKLLEPGGAHIVSAGSIILSGNIIYKAVPNN